MKTNKRTKSPRTHDLSIAELKKYPGLDKLSDQEAEYILNGIKELSLIYCLLINKQLQCGKIIAITHDKNSKLVQRKKAA